MNSKKGKDICQIGYREECCCICRNQYPATVCNCFGQWRKDMVFNPSPRNDRHGQIGWACTVFMSEGGGRVIEISRKQHGICECFIKKGKDIYVVRKPKK